MNTIQPPNIPDNYVAFAKAVADIAVANRIAKFQMTFEPRFEQKIGSDYDPRVRGNMVIAFADVDGRGRPCRNLAINLEAHLSLPIESNPESSS